MHVSGGLTRIPPSHHYNPTDVSDSDGISGGYPVQPPAHSRACPKDTGDLKARPHHSTFLQSDYKGEEGGRGKAIPNPAVKLRDLQVVRSPPWKGCDETFMLHKLFPAGSMHAQSALCKTHHRGITNLGQHLAAPRGNESSLPPSALALAGVCTGIVLSSYPLI